MVVRTVESRHRNGIGGGAKALLLTVLGEFVLPSGGSAWTSTLVASAAALGVGEKNARQAVARVGDQGHIAATRHGRRVRWELTDQGHRLLADGTERIYRFGTPRSDWDGRWLLAHCPVTEEHRPVRNQLRATLGFLGFGELAPSLLISPHCDRRPELRRVLSELNLSAESTVLISEVEERAEQADLVAKAWDLDQLAAAYDDFCQRHGPRSPKGPDESFAALVALVHDWRRFPSIDPELPAALLPAGWSGFAALELFKDRHRRWSPEAKRWFAAREDRS